jgi:hypothetical protein
MEFTNARQKLFGLALFVICCVALISGCASRAGSFCPQSHFTYPNSNVVDLGQVEARTSKRSWIIPPEIKQEDAVELMNKALAQNPEADLLINYKIDTLTTVIPVINIITTEMILSGHAASMVEIGRQEVLKNVSEWNYWKHSSDSVGKEKYKTHDR